MTVAVHAVCGTGDASGWAGRNTKAVASRTLNNFTFICSLSAVPYMALSNWIVPLNLDKDAA